MTRRTLIAPVLAAMAGATVFYAPAAAYAAPVGPCAEVPYVGVCIPPSTNPTPPQHNLGEPPFLPDNSSGVPVAN